MSLVPGWIRQYEQEHRQYHIRYGCRNSLPAPISYMVLRVFPADTVSIAGFTSNSLIHVKLVFLHSNFTLLHIKIEFSQHLWTCCLSSTVDFFHLYQISIEYNGMYLCLGLLFCFTGLHFIFLWQYHIEETIFNHNRNFKFLCCLIKTTYKTFKEIFKWDGRQISLGICEYY